MFLPQTEIIKLRYNIKIEPSSTSHTKHTPTLPSFCTFSLILCFLSPKKSDFSPKFVSLLLSKSPHLESLVHDLQFKLTKVVVTGNNRGKSMLVGLQGVVKKAVGFGGWHWLFNRKMETHERQSEQMERSDHVLIDIENKEIVPAAREQMNTSNSDSVDFENPATSLRRELKNMKTLSEDFSICRVPERLRHSNEKAYRPRIVSIGPIHHGREELKEMEEYKKKCLQDFLGRIEVSLEDFVELIQKEEEELRNCYAETIELSSHDFVKMILVDAAFVIEVLLQRTFLKNVNFIVNRNRVFEKPWLIVDLIYDMFVLENQLPFFILEDLFELSNITISSDHDSVEVERISMLKLTHEFACSYWDVIKMENLCTDYYSEVRHFVDFVRIRTQPSDLNKSRSAYRTAPSVKELHQAGVKFKLGSGKNLFDINFDRGILEIPKIEITRRTESVLRNVLAFEQCHCQDDYISDYARLMNSLLNTSKDVALLIESGIIENWLEDGEAVSTLFHGLVQGAVFGGEEDYYFTSLAEDLNRYCQVTRHKWMATLKQDYFNTPWASFSVAAAVVLLVLTVIQAVCSILQVI